MFISRCVEWGKERGTARKDRGMEGAKNGRKGRRVEGGRDERRERSKEEGRLGKARYKNVLSEKIINSQQNAHPRAHRLDNKA